VRPGRRPPRITRTQKPKTPDLGQGPAQLARQLEAHSLRLLLREPEALYKLDRCLQAAGLGRLGVTDYDHSEHQALARVILESLDQEEMEPAPYVLDHLPEAVQELAQLMLKPMSEGEPTSERLAEDLALTIIRLRLSRVNDTFNQLRYLQEEIQQQNVVTRGPYDETYLQYAQLRDRLDKALAQPLHFE
jgi:hypothetical protein